MKKINKILPTISFFILLTHFVIGITSCERTAQSTDKPTETLTTDTLPINQSNLFDKYIEKSYKQSFRTSIMIQLNDMGIPSTPRERSVVNLMLNDWEYGDENYIRRNNRYVITIKPIEQIETGMNPGNGTLDVKVRLNKNPNQ